MDVPSNEVLLRGLSMPHSPRWYRNQLWVLESGEGSLAVTDLDAATWQTVAELPGFTRGIDFYGKLAFIGLSQIRESSTFNNLPIIERLQDRRTCGVWVVNIETGQTVALLRFEAGAQEIFSVNVLPARYPDMLDFGDKLLAHSYVLSDDAPQAVPAQLRSKGE